VGGGTKICQDNEILVKILQKIKGILYKDFSKFMMSLDSSWNEKGFQQAEKIKTHISCEI